MHWVSAKICFSTGKRERARGLRLRIKRVDFVGDVTEADVLAIDDLELFDRPIRFTHQLVTRAELIDDLLLRIIHRVEVVLRRGELGDGEIVKLLRLEAAAESNQ